MKRVADAYVGNRAGLTWSAACEALGKYMPIVEMSRSDNLWTARSINGVIEH